MNNNTNIPTITQNLNDGLNIGSNTEFNTTLDTNVLALVLRQRPDSLIPETTNMPGEVSSYSESFPWFVDSNDTPIDYNAPLSPMEAVSAIHRYMMIKGNIDPTLLSDVKLSELISSESVDKELNLLGLYNRLNEILKSKNLDSLLTVNENTKFIIKFIIIITDLLKSKESTFTKVPLGEYGEVSLNQIVNWVKDREVKWLIDNHELVFNGVGLLSHGVSYGLLLKVYIKTIHNHPLPKFSNSKQKGVYMLNRQKSLLLFAFMGAPLILIAVKTIKPDFPDFWKSVPSTDLSNTNDGWSEPKFDLSLGLILSHLKEHYLKYIFIIFFIIVLILNFHKILFWETLRWLKLGMCLSGLWILYRISFLVILQIHINNKRSGKIVSRGTSVLPDFIIDWFNSYSSLVESEEMISVFKDQAYKDVYIYSFILLLGLIVLFI